MTAGFIAATFLSFFTKLGSKSEKQPLSQKGERNHFKKYPVAILSAALFSSGLSISGMTENEHIVGFLDMKGINRGSWDPSLLFVMGGGLLVSAISYEFVPGHGLMKVSVSPKLMIMIETFPMNFFPSPLD